MASVMQDDWDQHWKEYSESAERNPAQNYRRELIFTLLDVHGTGEGTRILDIGSGQGDMAAAIRARLPRAEILGLELSKSGVDISRGKVPNAEFLQCDLLQNGLATGEKKKWATHALCSEVIEHVDDPATLLRNARPYMADTCRLVITAPGGPMSAFDKHIGHRKHWNRSDLQELLRKSGYVAEHVSGVGFPFFNLYRCLVILRGRKLIGDVSAGANSAGARAAMSLFSRLMQVNLNSSRAGWQMVAIARNAPAR